MKTLTLDLYNVARTWLRFDGFDPYNTSPRLLDNMSEARYQRERFACDASPGCGEIGLTAEG